MPGKRCLVEMGSLFLINAGALCTHIGHSTSSNEEIWQSFSSSSGVLCFIRWACPQSGFSTFKMGLSAVASTQRIRQSFGDNTVSERTAGYWLQNLRSEYLSLCGKPRSEQPHVLDDEGGHGGRNS